MHLLKITLFLCIGLVISVTQPATAELYVDFKADVRHENNISHGGLQKDRLSDTVFSVDSAANYFFQMGKNTGFTLKTFAAYDIHQTYKNLDHATLGLESRFHFKPALAYTAPWHAIHLRLANQHYPDSTLRDNYHTDIELVSGKRLTDRISLKAGIGHTRQKTNDKKGLMPATTLRNPAVFDTESSRVFLGMDYRLDQLTFYSKYQYETGDIVSTRTSTEALNGHYDAWYWDDDLSPNTDGERRWAYRIDGRSRIFDLGMNYALKRSVSIDLLLRHVDTDAVGNNDYDNFSTHLGVFYRWK